MRPTAQQIGDEAERTLEGWANRAAFQIDQPVRDRLGIDREIELPSAAEAEPNVGLDHRPAPVRALIQVKGTTTGKRAQSIKLSILERFAKAPNPCFFLFVSFSPSLELKAAHLVPMDKSLIARTLARVRSEADPRQLHRRRMSVRSNDAHELSAPYPKAFVEAVRAHVEEVSGYPQRKRHWNETVGYSEHPYHYTFKGRTADFRDLIQGRIGSVDAELVDISETRFDITKRPPKGPRPGPVKVLEIRPSKRRIAFARFTNGGEQVTLQGEIESSAPFGQFLAPEEQFIAFKHSSLVLRFIGLAASKLTIDHLGCRDDLEHEDSIDDLAEAARAMRLVMTKGTALRLQTGRLSHEFGLAEPPSDPDLVLRARVFEVFREVARSAGVPTNTCIDSRPPLMRPHFDMMLDWSFTLPVPLEDVAYNFPLEAYNGSPLATVAPVWLLMGRWVATRVVTLVDDAPQTLRDGLTRFRPTLLVASDAEVHDTASLGSGRWFHEQVAAASIALKRDLPHYGVISADHRRLERWDAFCAASPQLP